MGSPQVIRIGPDSDDQCPYTKREIQTQTHTRRRTDSHLRTETDKGEAM